MLYCAAGAVMVQCGTPTFALVWFGIAAFALVSAAAYAISFMKRG